jgi:hypothetical protein
MFRRTCFTFEVLKSLERRVLLISLQNHARTVGLYSKRAAKAMCRGDTALLHVLEPYGMYDSNFHI